MDGIVVGSRVRLRGTDVVGYVLAMDGTIDYDGVYVLWQDIIGTKRSNMIGALCLYGEQPELKPKRLSGSQYVGRSEVVAAAVEKYLREQMSAKKPIKGLGITLMIDVVTKHYDIETGNHVVGFEGVAVTGAEKFDATRARTSFEIVDNHVVEEPKKL